MAKSQDLINYGVIALIAYLVAVLLTDLKFLLLIGGIILILMGLIKKGDKKKK